MHFEKLMSKATDSKNVAAASAQPTSWPEYVDDFRRAGHETVDWIAQYLSTVADSPVLAQVKPGQLFDALPTSAPVQGDSFDAILHDFDKLVMPAVTQLNHPPVFSYFACTGSTPAVLAEIRAAAVDPHGLHWHAPPPVPR